MKAFSGHLTFFLFFIASLAFAQTDIEWGNTIIVNDNPVLSYAKDSLVGPDLEYRSKYGSEYGRMLKLKDGSWLAAYTVSRNYGYKIEKDGGFELEIAESRDNGQTWKKVALISDKSRDLDNAQLIQLSDDSILLSCRSVRWQESY